MKTKNIRYSIVTIIACTALSTATSFADVVSTFDSDSDCWSETPTSGEVSWSNDGNGNPGGYLRFVDASGGPTWIIAPTKFHGSWAAYTTFCWDHKMIEGSASFQPQVTIYGRNGTNVTWWPPSSTGPTDWTHLVMPLQGQIQWGQMSIQDPAVFQSILNDVTNVTIMIDASPLLSGDVEGVDNVMLTAPVITCAGDKTVSLPPCPLAGGTLTETVLKHFAGAPGGGSSPQAGLLLASDGMLYGTTWNGGSNDVGTVFRMNPDGTAYQVLYQFSTAAGSPQNPHARLVEGTNGTFYGTTAYGGSNNLGTVYQLDANFQCTVLHSFNDPAVVNDGFYSWATLLIGQDGWLYGTSTQDALNMAGTVFKLNPSGTPPEYGYTLVHRFSTTDGLGYAPYDEAVLVQGPDGALYGTTYQGGSNNVGTVFTLSTDGTSYTVLHHFASSGNDGQNPIGGLLIGSDGMLYGTTYDGGSNGVGTVFRLDMSGNSYAVLYHFSATGGDGRNPYYTLVEACDGALYGTTYNGGSSRKGAVFKLNKDGSGYSLLHSFTSGSGDGANPITDLVSGRAGAFYGTTRFGGSNDMGTVFKLQVMPEWNFDAPTVSNACCGTNVTITVLSTVTNDSGSSLSCTRTWLITDCCGNTNTCSQTLTLQPAVGRFKDNNSDPLNESSSWVGGNLPGGTEYAAWDATVSAENTTNNLGSDQTWGGIQILDPAAPITITGSNTLSLNGAGIDMSAAVQDLAIACPLTVNSNQAWMIGSGRMLQMKNAVLVSAPLTIVGPGGTHFDDIQGEGVYPVDFTGSSYTEIVSARGPLSFQVDGSATLALSGSNSCTGPVTVNNGTLILQANSNNIAGGVCYALGTGLVTLGDGATLQLLADSNTVFGAGTTVTASNANVTINADTLTPGNTGQIISFASDGLNLGNVTVNVTGTKAILNLGVVTMMEGPVAFAGPGTLHIHGINKDGVYPVDFEGSSYGSPSEIEWNFGDGSKDTDGCGPIADTSELDKEGNHTLALWGTNTYTGPTIVSDGALVLLGDNSAVTNKTVVSGLATLALVANARNTRGGVCYALGSTELDLTNGATVQLKADSNTAFAGGANTVTFGNVTIAAGPLTAGGSNQTVSLGAAALICSGSNNIVNFVGQTNGYTLDAGEFYTHSGPLHLVTLGVNVRVDGISSNGVYPVDFTGSSYGTPSETEGFDQCGAITIGSAPFTKSGNNALVLTGINTYTGATTINAGTLVVKGSLSTGPVSVNGGILAGNGTINGAVTDYPGEGVYPVDFEGSSYGNTTLTINNTFTMQGTVTLCITKTGGTRSSDRIAGVTTANYGGLLVVTNVTSDGTALVAGDTFTLFSAAHYNNSFATLNLPPLNPGLAWNTSQLAVNGSISVVTTAPATIGFETISGGGGFNLNWPADQGWILQQTTNLLGPWSDLTTTSNAYQVVPALPDQFFRLRSGP